MRTVWIAVLVLALGAGLLLIGDHLPGRGGDDRQRIREQCLYASIEAYPETDLKPGQKIYGKIPECKGMNASDKQLLQDLLAGFFESAIGRTGE